MKPEEQHNQTPVGPYFRSTPHRSWFITSMISPPVMGESTSLSQTLLPLQKCVCGIKAVLKILLPLPEYVLSGRYDCFYKLMASFTFGVHHLVWGFPPSGLGITTTTCTNHDEAAAFCGNLNNGGAEHGPYLWLLPGVPSLRYI